MTPDADTSRLIVANVRIAGFLLAHVLLLLQWIRQATVAATHKIGNQHRSNV